MKWKKDPTKEIMMIWTKETDDGASQRCRAVTQRASEMELIRLRLTATGPGRGGRVTCTFYMNIRPVHKNLFWNFQKCKPDLCYILIYARFCAALRAADLGLSGQDVLYLLDYSFAKLSKNVTDTFCH